MTNDAFPPGSRYHDVDLATIVLPDGRTVSYVRRRVVPPADRHVLLVEHVVREGERLDQIAATYLGDPEQFWRVADANGSMAAEDLTLAVGRRLRITLPAGVPGAETD
jgi:hypothetical protein